MVEKLTLVPPVDVHELARAYADVEEANLPGTADGLIVADSDRPKPLIIIERTHAATRKRFTLAHEMGHLRISWHIPPVACHPWGYFHFTDELYRVQEAEANRFASALLMPIQWLKEIVQESTSIKQMSSALGKAEVSKTAISYALVRRLRPGYVLAEIDRAGLVIFSGRSPGSAVACPAQGLVLESETLSGIASGKEVIRNGPTNIVWWTIPDRIELNTSHLDHERGSTDILAEVADSLGLDKAPRLRLVQQVNGVIGAANTRFPSSDPERLKSTFLQRFAHKTDPIMLAVSQHALFESFISSKAAELARRIQEKSGT